MSICCMTYIDVWNIFEFLGPSRWEFQWLYLRDYILPWVTFECLKSADRDCLLKGHIFVLRSDIKGSLKGFLWATSYLWLWNFLPLKTFQSPSLSIFLKHLRLPLEGQKVLQAFRVVEIFKEYFNMIYSSWSKLYLLIKTKSTQPFQPLLDFPGMISDCGMQFK